MSTPNAYGLVLVLLHWLIAITVIGLFGLGLWMVDLGYYDPWYRRAPDLHKSIGFVVVIAMLGRLLIRLTRGVPAPMKEHRRWERLSARAAVIGFYILVIAMFPTGYLISTADGRPMTIFGLFELPALITGIDNLEDIAGEVHETLAFTLIGLVIAHACAALKHHFFDRDNTMRRILGIRG
jgi:cytochrome b561